MKTKGLLIVGLAAFCVIASIARAEDILRIEGTSVRMDTDRPIIALWASIPFGTTVTRGADIPPTWSFTVHENTIPGVTYVSVISDCVSSPETDCTANFISGAGLEVAQLSNCSATLFPEPALSGLLDNVFHEILTDCSARCCCESTLEVLPGNGCLLGVDVPPPPTWTAVKGIFR